ncbi:interferon-induced 6-16 family protein [Ceratobasidium sp. AG-Ba]|nr:interferon-induced 6-16 family protein [Ceratobasidium sp. AG-Ba]
MSSPVIRPLSKACLCDSLPRQLTVPPRPAPSRQGSVQKNPKIAKGRLLSEVHKLVESAKDDLRAEFGLKDFEPLDEDMANEHLSEVILDFGGVMKACEKRDCKHRYFVKATVRWIRTALKDMGVYVHENPVATAALFIGASVLIANLLSGDALVLLALKAIGFGPRGPIKGSIAALIQKAAGSIKMGSTFAQLQSAAMSGATIVELQNIATLAFAGLGIIGGTNLLGAIALSLSQATDFEPVEWRDWEAESRVAYSAEIASKMSLLWGSPKEENCVAYGYREYRARVWYVPEGADPVEVCLRTPAVIQGVGFKTPLGCVNESPKNGVIGTWYVQSNETRCTPQWSEFEDEVDVITIPWAYLNIDVILCLLTEGMYSIWYVEGLMGLGHQDDWNSMCESTPARLDGKAYSGPTYCEDKGVLGIYGIFDIPDEKCECYCAAN